MSLLLLLLHNANAQHSFPPPPKKKNWREIVAFLTIVLRQNLPLIFLRNFPQNRLFFPQICPLKSHEFVFFLRPIIGPVL